VDRPALPKDKVSSTLVADAIEARRWANTLLAGMPNADADLIQVICLVWSWLMLVSWVCVGCWLMLQWLLNDIGNR
jgi:hypothetical protein